MVNQKRIIITTGFGIVAGLICYMGAVLLNLPGDALRFINIMVNRTLIGFVIGISALRMHWALHGVLLGEIVGFPFFMFDLIIGVDIPIVIGVLIINAAFGIMIEFFATIVFKAPLDQN